MSRLKKMESKSQAIKEEINQKLEHIRESPPHGGLIFLAEPRNITVFSVVVVIFVALHSLDTALL